MNKQNIKLRVLIVSIVFSLCFTILIGRLFLLQVLDGSWLQTQAEHLWDESRKIPAVRGKIVDRLGNVLAEDTVAYTIVVSPKVIQEHHLAGDIASGLASILYTNDKTLNQIELEKKIDGLISKKKQGSNDYMMEVEIRNEGWKIDETVKSQVDELIKHLQGKSKLNDVGIYQIASSKRYYPNDELASQVLGYMSKDGKAVGGVEQSYNTLLQGKSGLLKRQKDGKGVETPESQDTLIPVVNGNTIDLTIDRTIQFYVQEALRKAYEKWHPKGMSAVAVDPNTMEVLAMASMPDFNPNRYWETETSKAFTNQAIASQYEPGSTFKLVTLAGAIEEGIFHPDELYDSGSIKVPGNTLHDYNTGWGKISFMEGLLRSSNVAFVKLGYERLQDKFVDYVKKFGFGQATGIDLPGEVSGVIRMKEPVEFATATFGQGPLAVTTLQQAVAYAAVANGGKLLTPHIVKEIVDPATGQVIQTVEPKFERQVVSEKTANEVKNDLEQVVANQKIGTGRNAFIPGYSVAGKTGTANIVNPGEKTYAKDAWLTSFIGFAPVEDPKIVVAVIADQPDLGGDFHKGGEVAPIVFKEIVSESLPYLNVPKKEQQQPILNTEAETRMIPDLTNMSQSEAKATMDRSGIPYEVLGKGEKVLKQFPPANREQSYPQTVYIVTEDPIGENDIPDLTGKSLRDVVEICTLLQLNYQVTGDGYVDSQRVSKIQDKAVLQIQLNPK